MSFNLSKKLIINALISFIPISFIAGNLIINLNILLFILISLIFYGKEIVKINLLFLDKLIIVFFSYLVLVALYKNVYQEYYLTSSEDLTVFIKTILYLRFLIIYFIIRYLIKFELLNFKILRALLLVSYVGRPFSFLPSASQPLSFGWFLNCF